MRGRLLLLATLVALVAPTVAHAAPSNDNLANAVTITSLPFRDQRNTGGATKQSGEPTPTCAPARSTLWYEIKLPEQTDVAITTTGSTYDAALGLYTATSKSFSKLKKLDCVNDLGTRQVAALAFTAEANKRYFVQVTRNGLTDGKLRLRVTTGRQFYVPETPVAGYTSSAARIVIAADQEQVEVIGRERVQLCYVNLCFPLADVGQEADLKPAVGPQTVRNCVVLFLFFTHCQPN